jgi:xylan 1,4-beta-xylosidase
MIVTKTEAVKDLRRTILVKKTTFAAAVFSLFLIVSFNRFSGVVFSATITVDCNTRKGAIPHFWSECVGTGTMEYCLKPAWTKAARMGVQEAGFKLVRGHGILIHGNNVDNIRLGSNPNWNFSVIDQIYDSVIACGLKPIVELDFMPPSLQSNGPYSPPNNYGAWKNLIASLVTHLESRYGVAEVRKWYFEVWNEFDYSGFWNSDAPRFYVMYDSAAAAVRSVDTNIIIGGPASTSMAPVDNFWKNCNTYGVKFISNHQYGVGTEQTALPTNIRNDNRERSNFIKSTGKNLFSLNTEFNSSYSGQGGNPVANCYSMDNHRNAPFVVKCMKLIIDDCIGGAYKYPDVLSYWSISDVFDEWWGNNSNSFIEGNNYVPFGQVFGLINYQGIKKAAFNAYVMLHKMGTIGLQLTGGSGETDGVDGFATVNADTSQVAVLVYSYYNDLTTSGADDNVNLVINNLPFKNGQQILVNHYRVDSLHSNPYGVWKKLKSPVTPSTAQWDSLKAHQNLEMMEQPTTIQYTGAPINKSLTLPRWSVSLLTFSKGATGTAHSAGAQVKSSMFTLHGTTLTVSSKMAGPVDVLVYGVNGRLIKQIRSEQRSVDLSAGLPKGIYLTHAAVAGNKFTGKIAIY